MIKLFLLSKILNHFIQISEPESFEYLAKALQSSEHAWVAGKLSDSYENEILVSMGLAPQGKSMDEYRTVFWELGLEIEHLEIKREMIFFNGIKELKVWIQSQVESEALRELYLAAMQQKGWVDGGEGKIGFPTRQLIACLKLKG